MSDIELAQLLDALAGIRNGLELNRRLLEEILAELRKPVS